MWWAYNHTTAPGYEAIQKLGRRWCLQPYVLPKWVMFLAVRSNTADDRAKPFLILICCGCGNDDFTTDASSRPALRAFFDTYY